jgi:hypothetical protein
MGGGGWRWPLTVVSAVVVVAAVNGWAVARRGSGAGRTPVQIAHGDVDVAELPTLLVTDGETAKSGAVRPPAFGSSHFRIEAIAWRTWSDDHAAGKGTVVSNVCEPSCAAGNYESYPVSFSVSKPVTACGGRFFSTVTFTPAGPRGSAGMLDFLQPVYRESPARELPCE